MARPGRGSAALRGVRHHAQLVHLAIAQGPGALDVPIVLDPAHAGQVFLANRRLAAELDSEQGLFSAVGHPSLPDVPAGTPQHAPFVVCQLAEDEIAEWAVFRDAYAQHVELTPDERRLWPVALQYMLLEWCVWSLIAAEEWGDWERPQQRGFLTALADAELEIFAL